MWRSIRISFGLFALIGNAFSGAFAIEVVQRSVTEEDSSGGTVESMTRTVCSSGCDFTTIRAALDAAQSGDTIQLGPETFEELNIVTRDISVVGAGPERTVLRSPQYRHPPLTVMGGSVSQVTIADSNWGVVLGLYGTVRDSVLRGNGIGIRVAFGYNTIANCTIVDNETGILTNPIAYSSIVNSTIVGNSFAGARLETASQGGLIFDGNTVHDNPGIGVSVRLGGAMDFRNNILTNNGDNFELESLGGLFECSHNLLSDLDPDFVAIGGNCVQTSPLNVDPMLLPLAYNGGATPTHALARRSPAIDAGGDDCLPTDQRGVARPQDGNGDGVAKCDIGAYELDVLAVSIDIKPYSFPNSINPHSRGVIPLAVLGSETFDVADIDVTTLAFGPDDAPIAHLNGHLQDVNYDGIMDLMTHYRTRDTGIMCGDESAALTGATLDGEFIEGFDSIETVGCRVTRRPAIWMKDQDRPDTPRRDGPVNIERK